MIQSPALSLTGSMTWGNLPNLSSFQFPYLLGILLTCRFWFWASGQTWDYISHMLWVMPKLLGCEPPLSSSSHVDQEQALASGHLGSKALPVQLAESPGEIHLVNLSKPCWLPRFMGTACWHDVVVKTWVLLPGYLAWDSGLASSRCDHG